MIHNMFLTGTPSAPVLIDDLGRTCFLLSSSFGLWEPSRGVGLCAAGLGREEELFFKT